MKVTGSPVIQLPSLSTRTWWLSYVFGPVVLVGIGVTLFPRLVHDQYLWQYIWGPVVADGAGHPVTQHGITAVKGYNPYNTLTFVGIIIYALPGVRRFLRTFEIDVDARLAFGLAPLLVAGGAMRALEDANLLPSPIDLLFITPGIYFVTAGVAFVLLVLGVYLRARWAVEVSTTVASVGTAWSVLAVGTIVWYGLGTAHTFRLGVLLTTITVAAIATGTFYATGSLFDRSTLRRPMVLLLVFGQLLDATQNLIGVTFYGYTPKLFVTKVVYGWTNFTGSTFLLKLAAVILVVWVVGDRAETDPGYVWWWLVLFTATAVGLPQGVRGTLRIVIGV